MKTKHMISIIVALIGVIGTISAATMIILQHLMQIEDIPILNALWLCKMDIIKKALCK